MAVEILISKILLLLLLLQRSNSSRSISSCINRSSTAESSKNEPGEISGNINAKLEAAATKTKIKIIKNKNKTINNIFKIKIRN
ncbi:hypothetical protein HYG87_10705 [Methanobacterium alkalithermotolerans]|uniref:Uncharacterized protein n=1 Tax=Methanobacterium alkalithermotolerans TaxID=2731220 RepID=A0A8T8KAQ8_9EURY|nr:hypothetical protein [Methanobacterium alkalithermotolerans]QUH24193.1 hypothetical protein HYG87_10705 [Methanobacterium alkalithermotolerans]